MIVSLGSTILMLEFPPGLQTPAHFSDSLKIQDCFHNQPSGYEEGKTGTFGRYFFPSCSRSLWSSWGSLEHAILYNDYIGRNLDSNSSQMTPPEVGLVGNKGFNPLECIPSALLGWWTVPPEHFSPNIDGCECSILDSGSDRPHKIIQVCWITKSPTQEESAECLPAPRSKPRLLKSIKRSQSPPPIGSWNPSK